MKKIVAILYILTLTFGVCFAQSRQRNFIYVLDCTKSMCGYNGTPNIWAQTKHFLKTELEKESKDNPDARIVVIPFQQFVLSPEFVDPRNINW